MKSLRFGVEILDKINGTKAVVSRMEQCSKFICTEISPFGEIVGSRMLPGNEANIVVPLQFPGILGAGAFRVPSE